MKVVLIVLGVIVVLVVGGITLVAMNFGTVIEQGIETGGSKVLQVPVEVADVDFSIFEGKGSIKGFTIDNPDGFDEPHALVVEELAIAWRPRDSAAGKRPLRLERGTSDVRRA